jgi:enediyne biosynthesis protein E4
LFEDVTEKAGIAFTHTNGEPMQYPFPETLGGGCAFLDLDQDGWQDVLLLSCGSRVGSNTLPNLALYRNKRDGTFEDVSAQSGLTAPMKYAQALAVADYDNDGRADIFVAGWGDSHLFRATGSTPLYEDVTASSGMGALLTGTRWASCATWGDYDNDGKLDLYVARYAIWTPETDKQCPRADGSPGFCEPTVYEPDTPTLYKNLGGGKFKDITAQSGLLTAKGRTLAISWVDFDGDGWEDIFAANDMNPNLLWRNNRNGTFTEIGVTAGVAYGTDGISQSGMGIAVGDFDGSGRESLLVPNLNGQIFSLFQNEGGGLFVYASDRTGLRTFTQNYSGFGAVFLDFDRDGWRDLATANGHINPTIDRDVPGVTYAEPRGLFRNQDGKRFENFMPQSGALQTPRASRGLAMGDFDNDGRVDLLCVNRNERAELFRNVGKDANHWLSLSLNGTNSNRDGVGAKVMVSAGGRKQFATCRPCGSYASTSDKRLFFGLGKSMQADSVTIRWSSGKTDTFRNLRAERQYEVTEGGKILPISPAK